MGKRLGCHTRALSLHTHQLSIITSHINDSSYLLEPFFNAGIYLFGFSHQEQ
jgi:hypothetical protein